MAGLAVAIAAAGPVPEALAASITVTTTADEYDLVANGTCSLREAIQSANLNAPFGGCSAGDGVDTILIPAGTYTLTRPGMDDTNVNGDLDVQFAADLVGQGRVVINANGAATGDRVLDFAGSVAFSLSNVTITGGMTGDQGGGIRTFAASTVTITGVTIAGNVGDGGGGIRVGGDLTMTNSTVSGNQSVSGGGGIESGTATVSLATTTVTTNTADSDASNTVGDDGGGVKVQVGSIELRNSIVTGNSDKSPTVVAPDCSGTPTSLGNNLIGNTTNCGFVAMGTDKVDVLAGLGPLADNGGPTQTHALLVGSPAIDAGGAGCPPTDQRGAPRSGACDIGAYERVLCRKVAVNRIGTEGNDPLVGTGGTDGILGLGGKDKLSGAGGKDALCGGPGKDTLKGGGGKDTLDGGPGKDTCIGQGGKDKAKACEKLKSI